jgi:hypothetical protein
MQYRLVDGVVALPIIDGALDSLTRHGFDRPVRKDHPGYPSLPVQVFPPVGGLTYDWSDLPRDAWPAALQAAVARFDGDWLPPAEVD